MNKPLIITAFILLAFIIFGLVGMDHNAPDELASDAESPLQSDYDYYLNGMVVDHFAPDGTHNYRLTADRVTHFPEGDISILITPAFSWYEAGRPSWLMTAQNGVLKPEIDSGQNSLLLEDNVIAKQSDQNGNVMTINTETLKVFLATQEASTEAPVTLQKENMHLSGIGMHAWLEQDKIKLLSQVKGRYE